jgi:hypothetical protein
MRRPLRVERRRWRYSYLMKGKTGVNRDAYIELLQALCVLEHLL